MGMKSVLCAAALILAPFSASAVTLNPSNMLVDDGKDNGADNTYVIQGGPFHWEATANVTDDANIFYYYQFKFTSTDAYATGSALSTVLQASAGFFELVIGWVDGQHTWLNNTFNGAALHNTKFVPGVTDTLVVAWSGIDPLKTGGTGTANVKLTVAAVPVPAGALLLGTALLGFGLMRRRRKHA